MREIKIAVWEKEEYTYEGAEGEAPYVKGYLHESGEKRPAMLIAPGGGYVYLAPIEAEPIAEKFYEQGFQVFICRYSINKSMKYPLKKQPLKDLAKAVQLVRGHSDEWGIDAGKIVVFGASAGGHLTGSLAVHFDNIGMEDCRPDAVVLAYPVVSTNPELIHRESFRALLGDDPDSEELEYMSVEKQVRPGIPPCFIWHTMTDSEVSAGNSFALAKECMKNKIVSACHIFSEGEHGMGLAEGECKQVERWPELVMDWLKSLWGRDIEFEKDRKQG